MILPKDFLIRNIDKIKANSYDYSVLEIRHLQFEVDTKRFNFGIGIANLCNIFAMVNLFFEQNDIQKNIDFSILFEVMEAIYTNKDFSDSQLENFYAFNKELENLEESMQNISPDLSEHLYVPVDIEMLLIGFDLNKIISLNEVDRRGIAGEEFYNMKRKVIENKMTVNQFKAEGLNLLEKALNGELKIEKVVV